MAPFLGEHGLLAHQWLQRFGGGHQRMGLAAWFLRSSCAHNVPAFLDAPTTTPLGSRWLTVGEPAAPRPRAGAVGSSLVALHVIDHPNSPQPAHPASTVLLLRDGPGGVEVLMIHRSSKTAFGGLWAFPGGRIEDEDVPDGTGEDPLPAARRAAARETMEEVGLQLEEDSLVWISHWLPPANAPVRFSTWFFAAAAPDGLVAIDQDEVHDHRWMRPADALASHHDGEIELVTPTFVTLEGLAGCENVATALAWESPEFFATRIAHNASGARVCLYAGDAGYDSGDCQQPGPRRRLVMGKPQWVWEDTR